MIWVPNQLVGAPCGTDVTIDCHTEAHPRYRMMQMIYEGMMYLFIRMIYPFLLNILLNSICCFCWEGSLNVSLCLSVNDNGRMQGMRWKLLFCVPSRLHRSHKGREESRGNSKLIVCHGITQLET